MIRVSIALAFSLAIAAPAAANPETRDPLRVPAGNYELDGRHATLLAKAPHMGGFSKFTMRFDKLSGGFTYDPANWGATRINIVVDPASVRTNLPDFDKTIAGSSYLNVAKHPTITFVASKVESVEGGDGKGTVSGDLTFLGVTRPVVLDVVFNGVGPGLLGAGTRMGFSGTGHIKRSEFGLTTMSQMAGDDLDLMFEVEFVKK